MPSAEATIATDKAGRYLTQLCQHASQATHRLARLHLGRGQDRPEVRNVASTDTDGTLQLSWGTCTLHAEPGTLTVRADADDADDLQRLQDLVARDLERFGHREHLTVTWHPVDRPTPGAADHRHA
jgi:hypothetical protein